MLVVSQLRGYLLSHSDKLTWARPLAVRHDKHTLRRNTDNVVNGQHVTCMTQSIRSGLLGNKYPSSIGSIGKEGMDGVYNTIVFHIGTP